MRKGTRPIEMPWRASRREDARIVFTCVGCGEVDDWSWHTDTADGPPKDGEVAGCLACANESFRITRSGA